MKKTTINGMQYVAVREVREELRYLRKNIDTLYCNFDKEKRAMVHLAYNDVVRALYREELEAAKTPEEHKAIIEMPGDFMVIHKIGKAFFGRMSDPQCLVEDAPTIVPADTAERSE